MKLILNIGLDVIASASIASHVALEIVKANGFLVHNHAVVQSDTEPTLVVEASLDPLPGNAPKASFYGVAEDLKQDCIAAVAWDAATAQYRGALIGPRAEAWGKFDPTLFFRLDGSRLAPHAGADAKRLGELKAKLDPNWEFIDGGRAYQIQRDIANEIRAIEKRLNP